MPARTVQNRPCVVVIRDGWGENPEPRWHHADAVRLAAPPTDAMLRHHWPFTLIRTSGLDVGLPADTIGNSEVGHQNIGAGRIVDQDAVRISKAIADGSFFGNAELVAAVEKCLARRGRLHLMGLASDTGVHSRLEHLYACVELAARRGLRQVYVHCFTDGRDSPPTSGAGFLQQIEDRLGRIGVGQVASVCGRYWAMDRDNRWPRTEKAYRMLTRGEGEAAPSALDALERYYRNPVEPNMKGDEFVPPTVISEDGLSPLATVRDGDSVVFFNFRGDRPRQLVRAFVAERFPYREKDRDGTEREQGFARTHRPDTFFVTMTAYEEGLGAKVAFPKPPRMENIAGEHLSRLGLRQYRAAETEKYAHVTFFFNDYREEPFPGEERELVPSPKVSTYDQKPEMSAFELTDAVLRRLRSGVDDVLILNYANGDMVGHTGVLEAAVAAVKAVDECVGRVLDAIRTLGGCAIVTADHGNCELMIDPETGGPHTAHTTFDVPLYLFGAAFKGLRLRDGGRLADVMPTAFAMLGVEVPPQMTGRSLMV
ncbi:MAG: 2,3-bisphosphoglycerate-independent phosphoglycerate mutase [Phycisphaerae bacterium]|nr:2,3-bisphosphoglycerate-independent phosphoglycerate mutase [Phycisphaerae bacterium]MCZ2400684.1 2,3-bisphosphoglycerate-independent phosphoglycerate mutase [Phycisphaerae bacterium]NUQ49156.1 2,3-bisphosphoglycerate-independent phosphoglycerate mutase [Phycisphaerae bacterium]